MKKTWLIGPSISSTLPIGVHQQISPYGRFSDDKLAYFVFEVDGRIELWHFWIARLTNHLAFTRMNKRAHFCNWFCLVTARDCTVKKGNVPKTAAGGPYDG